MSGEKTRQSQFLRRISPAGVPGRKTNKSIKKAQRQGQNQRVADTDVVRNGEEVREEQTEKKPNHQIKRQPPEIDENRMHVALVFHDHAAQNGHAFHDQSLLRNSG